MTNDYIAALAVTTALLNVCFTLWIFVKVKPNHRHRKLEADVSNLLLELAEYSNQNEKTFSLLKKINQREVMRERRGKKSTNGIPDPDEDPEGWKREMMKRRILGAMTND